MKVINDFINIVCLGKFNPSILNKEFVKDNKIYDAKEEKSKPIFMPVMTNIGYDNIDFFIDLERFQIMQKVEGLEFTNKVIEIMFNYLKTLKYTPINIIGINLNSKIFSENNKRLIDNLNDEKIIYDIFKTKEYVFTYKIRRTKEEREYLNWTIESLNISKENLVKRLFITKQPDNYEVNFNMEIINIKDFKEIHYFLSSFEAIKGEYLKMIFNIFGE